METKNRFWNRILFHANMEHWKAFCLPNRSFYFHSVANIFSSFHLFPKAFTVKSSEFREKRCPDKMTQCDILAFITSLSISSSRPIIEMMLIHTPDFNPPIILLRLLPSVSAFRFPVESPLTMKNRSLILSPFFLREIFGKWEHFFRVNWCFGGMFH